MRRGHPGRGGWRNENPRHFRPRNAGSPGFRPSRPFQTPLHEIPRYPMQSQQRFPFRAPQPDQYHDRNKFQMLSRKVDHRNQEQPGGRLYARHNERPNIEEDFTTDHHERYHVNNMGDIDHRQPFAPPPRHEPFIEQPQWANRNRPRPFIRHDDPHENQLNKPPIQDIAYSGHRPPASDHYEAIPSGIDNSNAFSRSVDDTVDIIRRKLQNRNDPQNHALSIQEQDVDMRGPPDTYQQRNVHEDITPRKKTQRPRQNMKSNCDQIKNKIVHQLFKMDKGRIHKLMDNPNSSTKFEYAISSLITESQNSFNRHLRETAEKSLCGTRNDITPYNDENDTIYEDTFMKQMQCILEPQDTILLEDIKPIVMAELNKVLQLTDFSQMQAVSYEEANMYPSDHHDEYYPCPEFAVNPENDPQCGQAHSSSTDPNHYEGTYRRSDLQATETSIKSEFGKEKEKTFSSPSSLFERRISAKSCDYSRAQSSESGRVNVNADKSFVKTSPVTEPPIPYFDANAEHLSDDDDPFEELDKQYHVAVDHNFIADDDMIPQTSHVLRTPPQKETRVERTHTPRRDSHMSTRYKRHVKQEICDSADLPLEVLEVERKNILSALDSHIKSELLSADATKDLSDTVFEEKVMPQKDYALAIPSIKNERPRESKEREGTVFEEKVMPQKDYALAIPSIKKERPRESKEREETVFEEKVMPQKDNALAIPSIRKERPHESKEREEVVEKSDSSNMSSEKSSVNSNSRKRSIDQRPSHRKEKRKKSESSPSDTSKQVLNKNIIINLNNDCTAKNTEKHDLNAKSVFNLYFSKRESAVGTDDKKSDGSTSNYTEKYVKRKESPQKGKKPEEKEKKDKTHSISSNHSIRKESNTNTKDSHASIRESNASTKENTDLGTSKGDNQVKLKSIDIFNELPKKVPVHVHQSHRNTATPVKTQSPAEKKFPMLTIRPLVKSKQVTRKHVATQIFRKMYSKMIQTDLRHTKSVEKSVQTEPVSFERSTKTKSADAFERMKEIDMEIQSLIQEKFKLYNSLETKENTSSMQTLGMTVLNVQEKDTEHADSIIEDFANIPEDELAEIALESVTNDDDFEPREFKKSKNQNAKKKNRNRSQSPTTRQLESSNKGKTPNISLLEQIITDDRPLEDIISLDDLEASPAKSQKKTKRKPVKKAGKPKIPRPKERVVTPTCQQIKPLVTQVSESAYNVKPCFVVLTRVDAKTIAKDTIKHVSTKHEEKRNKHVTMVTKREEQVIEIVDDTTPEPANQEKTVTVTEDLIEEPAENDFHYQVDMLDVSEDIVIGSEVKIEDKESESVPVPVTEEVVLDNSQSSEEVGANSVEPKSGECKMYDFSADEDLKHDAVTVTGNGDAVLAIEFVEQNFLAACLDGNVYHFGADGQLLTTLRGSNLAVTCLTIVREKYGTTVYTGSLDSRIRYYDLEDGLEKGPECNVLSPIQTMDRAWDTVFVGTRTGFVLQFECKNNMLIPVSTIKFSEQSILALRALKEGPRKVLLVAARSENVTIKDAQTGLLLRTLVGPKMTVYTLLYEDGKVFCGTSSNQVQAFDYASGTHIGVHDGGKGAVCLRAAGGLLFAGCYDGCVYVFRAGERRPFAQLRGPGVMLLSLAVVGSKVIVGYKDRSLYIWKIPVNILQEMVL